MWSEGGGPRSSYGAALEYTMFVMDNHARRT
jgi:hypothetical protein